MNKPPLRLVLKLGWLAVLVASPFMPSSYMYTAVISSAIAAFLLLAISGNLRIAFLIASNFGIMASAVVLVDYAAGTDYLEAARRLAYTISTALLLAYIALSTSVSEAEALLGRNVLTQSLIFIGVLRSEVVMIGETLRARGHEFRGPRSLIPLVVAFLSCISERASLLEDSLRARGAE
jgi:hypothetical protein